MIDLNNDEHVVEVRSEAHWVKGLISVFENYHHDVIAKMSKIAKN